MARMWSVFEDRGAGSSSCDVATATEPALASARARHQIDPAISSDTCHSLAAKSASSASERDLATLQSAK